MEAESGGSGELLKVLGEYGVFLVEMGSLKDIYGAAKTSSRIKYNCISVGKKFIAVGATPGGIYLYHKKTLEYFRLLTTKDGAVTKVCFALEKNYLGFATSNGIVVVVDIGSRTRDKPKYLRRSEEHKAATVTCLCWDDTDSRLFASDDRGFVSATYLPTKFGSSHGKRGLIGHNSAIVGKSETAINQIDYAADKLLISTMTKTAVLDLATLQCWLVGSKPREGKFGACFLKQFNQESATIYTSRPGSRLWEAGMDGQVISTQQYKHLLAVPPSPVLGYGHEIVISPLTADECQPKSLNFSKLFLIRDRFLLTWIGADVFLLDPVLGQLTGWYQLHREISDVCCCGNQFYAYHDDGHMTWFGVLTVKETIARLFELSDFQQCSKVAVECKSYLIPSSARDWVPISMVTSLVKSIQVQPGTEDVVVSLQDLEQSLQEDTSLTLDKPPGFLGDSSFHGNSNFHSNSSFHGDSPETMSINSDVCSLHMDSGLEDDDNLSINQNDTKSGKRRKNGNEFSLENALFTVAFKAKRFAEERRSKHKLNLPNLKSLSTENENEKLEDERGAQEPNTPSALNEEDMCAQQQTHVPQELRHKADSGALETSQGVPSNSDIEKTVARDSVVSSGVLVDSDDNDSRCDDDLQDLKKTKEKTKKKKKKKVITVDINTPAKMTRSNKSQSTEAKESLEPMDNKHARLRSQSERATSPILAPRMIDVPSELPPAIPAMLSKAKGIIKRKLKETGSDNQRFARSQSLPSETRGEVSESDDDEEDVEEEPCPLEVEDLGKATLKTREQIQLPNVLYSRSALQQTLQEWLPALYSALRLCNGTPLNPMTSIAASPAISSRSSSVATSFTTHIPATMLNKHLGEEVYKDVCSLTKMCLDVGVFCAENHNDSKMDSTVDNHKACIHGSQGVEDCMCGKVGNRTKWENGKSEEKTGSQDSECLCDGTNVSSSCLHNDNCSLHKAENIDKPDNEKCRHETRRTENVFTKWPSEDTKKDDCKNNIDNDISHTMDNCSCHNRRCSSDSILATKKPLEDSLHGDKPGWSCSSCSKHFNSKFHTTLSSLPQPCMSAEMNRDKNRALFIRNCFSLLKVQDIRRTLSLTPGIKWRTWKTLLKYMKEFSKDDDIAGHIKDGHVTRALHVLHDGIGDYQDTLLLHLNSLYEQNGRETVTTCARMFPDVLPWEVMEMCRHGGSHDYQASAQYFVYYVEQLIRWRASIREKRSQIIKSLSKDREFMKTWFHSALIASNPDGQRHCECGLPRPGSHRLSWKHEEYLHEVLQIVCEQHNYDEINVFLHMSWKHGYWPGFLQLCSVKGYRLLVLQCVVCLQDMALLDANWPWGPTPQSIDEWRLFLELVASKSTQHIQPSTLPKESDWIPNMTWESVLHLALKRLGSSRLVPLLQDVPYQEMSLPVGFYYKCIMGIVIGREQSNLVHQMLTTVDTYLWSKRAGVLTPQMNYSRIQEQNSTSKEDNSSVEKSSIPHVKTLEDAATNWGVNVHLAEAACPVCTLHLSEQVSSSNQGLLVFECGHVFHKFCVPEHACVVCFQKHLKTLGKTRMLNEGSPMKME